MKTDVYEKGYTFALILSFCFEKCRLGESLRAVFEILSQRKMYKRKFSYSFDLTRLQPYGEIIHFNFVLSPNNRCKKSYESILLLPVISVNLTFIERNKNKCFQLVNPLSAHTNWFIQFCTFSQFFSILETCANIL